MAGDPTRGIWCGHYLGEDTSSLHSSASWEWEPTGECCQWVLQTVTQGYHIPLTSEHIRGTMPYNPHWIRPCCRRTFIPCWRSRQYRSPSPNKGLLLPYIRDTKKRWCLRSVIYLIRLNYNVEVKTLQDGESPYSEIPSPKGRLDDQGRLERCLLHGTKSKIIPPSFLLQGKCSIIPISVSSFWVMQVYSCD